MKIILVILTFVAALMLSGCAPSFDDISDNESAFATENGSEGAYTSENEEDVSSTSQISAENREALERFFEWEAWDSLELLFESVEDELSRFVAYLEENDLLSAGRIPSHGRRIPFPTEDRRFVHRPGWLGRYPELCSIVEEIEESGVLLFITIPELQSDSLGIRFIINIAQTSLSAIHRGPPNGLGFVYVIGEDADLTIFGYRQIRDGWYMFRYSWH